jgi:hypothetical protein
MAQANWLTWDLGAVAHKDIYFSVSLICEELYLLLVVKLWFLRDVVLYDFLRDQEFKNRVPLRLGSGSVVILGPARTTPAACAQSFREPDRFIFLQPVATTK